MHYNVLIYSNGQSRLANRNCEMGGFDFIDSCSFYLNELDNF